MALIRMFNASFCHISYKKYPFLPHTQETTICERNEQYMYFMREIWNGIHWMDDIYVSLKELVISTVYHISYL